MTPTEYVFRIDIFTPETLAMGRLAQYLAALAKMLGHEERIHFIGIERGSAKLRTAIDPVDAPKVEARLNGLRVGDGPKESLSAKQTLDEMLANDNAIGELIAAGSGQVILAFAGRNRPRPLAFPAFREDTSIYGVLVSIGGRDHSAHAQLQDGDILHVGITMRRELARQLAKLLYGPTLRLHGNGRFERHANGIWKMSDFRVDRHEVLEERPLRTILDEIRTVPGNRLMEPDAYQDIVRLQRDEGADDL